jgi:hypothetical protein
VRWVVRRLQLARIMNALRLGLLAVLAVTAACADPSTGDDVADNESAQTAGDILTMCPALESIELSGDVVSDPDVLVRQTYRQHEWKNGQMLPQSREFTSAQNPAALYGIQFYRDPSGRSKFRLGIGAFAGMDGSIEGNVKRLRASGTVTFDNGSSTSGVLTMTSRRDGLASILGDVTTLRFYDLDCSAGSKMVVTMPVVTLDKTTDRTVEITDSAGRRVQVTPTVRWVKKADSAPIALADRG